MNTERKRFHNESEKLNSNKRSYNFMGDFNKNNMKRNAAIVAIVSICATVAIEGLHLLR